MKSAFSMIELVLVIAIIGTLLAIATPKIMISRTDANLALSKSQVASIISGISIFHSQSILQGKDEFPDLNIIENNTLFTQIISGGIKMVQNANEDGWRKIALNEFGIKVGDKDAIFIYDQENGTFECANANGIRDGLCKDLLQ